MKKIFIGIILTLGAVLIFYTGFNNPSERAFLVENSMLIQKELKKVSKLVVTEGNFVEVYTYSHSKEIFGTWKSSKKALVVINASVTISYDLSAIDYELDEVDKTLFIHNIPDPEVTVNPNLEYYDVDSGYFNPFDAEDYNRIKEDIGSIIQKKIEASPLKKDAKNRLITELSRFYVLTNSMGWTFVYRNETITDLEDIGAREFKE